MLQFHESNPFRPVNWRWEYARALRESKFRNAKHATDYWITTAFRFQSGLFKCKQDIDRYDLMDSFPDIYGAYLIYQRGENEDRHPMRYAIEARLLARQSPEDIASRLGLSTRTIEAYERLFFNVTEKLENNDYVMTCVIGPSIYSGLSERDYDLLWKLFGYLYGPTLLDSFIATTTRKYKPESMAEVDAALSEDTRSTLQRKVAIVARTYVVNPFSQSELLNIYARLLEMEKDVGGEQNRDVILQNVQVMLDKLPFKTGDDSSQPALISKYDETGAELHTNELLSVSSGEDTVNEALLNDMKFPEQQTNVKPTK